MDYLEIDDTRLAHSGKFRSKTILRATHNFQLRSQLEAPRVTFLDSTGVRRFGSLQPSIDLVARSPSQRIQNGNLAPKAPKDARYTVSIQSNLLFDSDHISDISISCNMQRSHHMTNQAIANINQDIKKSLTSIVQQFKHNDKKIRSFRLQSIRTPDIRKSMQIELSMNTEKNVKKKPLSSKNSPQIKITTAKKNDPRKILNNLLDTKANSSFRKKLPQIPVRMFKKTRKQIEKSAVIDQNNMDGANLTLKINQKRLSLACQERPVVQSTLEKVKKSVLPFIKNPETPIADIFPSSYKKKMYQNVEQSEFLGLYQKLRKEYQNVFHGIQPETQHNDENTARKSAIDYEIRQIVVRRRCGEIIDRMRKFFKLYYSLRLPFRKIFHFPHYPYFHPSSTEFFDVVKSGNATKMAYMISEISPYLVFEFDEFRQTALHWAVRQNHLNCVKILLESKAIVDSLDILGRPPMYYAIKAQNLALVRLLFGNNASVWSCSNANYVDLAEGNKQIIGCIKIFRLLEIFLILRRHRDSERTKRLFLNSSFSTAHPYSCVGD